MASPIEVSEYFFALINQFHSDIISQIISNSRKTVSVLITSLKSLVRYGRVKSPPEFLVGYRQGKNDRIRYQG